MKYEEYLKSDQKKSEDRIFLEFNRRHGLDDGRDHIRATQGVINSILIVVAIGVLVWAWFF
jgi:hypothetical protein